MKATPWTTRPAAAVAVGAVLAAALMTVQGGTVNDTGGRVTTETTVHGPETSVAIPPITTPPFTIPTGEPQ